jgi:hypothetical protein
VQRAYKKYRANGSSESERNTYVVELFPNPATRQWKVEIGDFWYERKDFGATGEKHNLWNKIPIAKIYFYLEEQFASSQFENEQLPNQVSIKLDTIQKLHKLVFSLE